MSSPIISIYIPCHNYGKYLSKALQSISSQLYKNWELFLVDDASKDNTFDLMMKYKNENIKNRVHVIRNKNAEGLQKIANNVLKRCNGELIFRLDADDWLLETALLSLVIKYETTAQKFNAIIVGDYFLVDSKEDIIGFQTSKPYNVDRLEGRYYPPHGACSLISVRLLKSVGGYSTDFKAQDGWDLWQKTHLRADIHHVESPIFYYRQHEKSLSKSNQRLLDSRRKIISSKLINTSYVPSVAFIVGAKSKYENFINTPLIKYEGIPLIDRAVNSISHLKNLHSIFYITDSKDVNAHIENKYSNLKVFPVDPDRAKQLISLSSPPIDDYMKELVKFFKSSEGELPDMVCYINIHSINRSSSHINDAINQLMTSNADSLLSVEKQKDILLSADANYLSVFYSGRYNTFKNVDDHLLAFNGAFVLSWLDAITHMPLFESNIIGFEMTNDEGLRLTSSLFPIISKIDRN